MLTRNTVTNWLQENIHVCLVAISMLFIYKPLSFESFGLFLLASGAFMWYSKETAKPEPLTIEDVEIVSREICYQMINQYMEVLLQPPDDDFDDFNSDNFPPFSQS